MRAVWRYPFNAFRWVAALGLMLALAGAAPAEEVLAGNALSPSPSQPATPSSASYNP